MAKTAQSFASVLDMPASAIEPPKTFPVGSYVCVVQGQPRIDKSSKKQTEFSEYTLKVLEALDDVDTDALDAFLTKKDGTKKPLSEQTLKHTFYHTEDSVYRLWQFFEHCGLDVEEAEEEGTTTRQMIAETPGCQVIAHVAHEASQDGERVFARVKNTTKVES